MSDRKQKRPRNVKSVKSVKAAKSPEFDQKKSSPEQSSKKHRNRTFKATVDSAGRILIPAKLRKVLDIEPGKDVTLTLNRDVLEIRSLDDAINQAQSLVRKYVSKKKSLVDELIVDRKIDANRR